MRRLDGTSSAKRCTDAEARQGDGTLCPFRLVYLVIVQLQVFFVVVLLPARVPILAATISNRRIVRKVIGRSIQLSRQKGNNRFL